MELAIIAAGRGSRLKSDGINISKPLIRINNIPIIKRLIDCGIQNGADKIHCIINDESADLKEYLLNENFQVNIHLIVKSTLGSLHSFFELAPLITENYFCLAMPDLVFSCEEFSKFISYSTTQDNFDGILAVTGSIADEKPLYIQRDKNTLISKFSDHDIHSEIGAGSLYYFSTSIYNEMSYALSENMTHLRNYLQLLLVRGYHFKAFEFSRIIDIDHLSDIEAAEQFVNRTSSQNRQYVNNSFF